jgi:PAS domain S-box-containing protein
MTAREKNIGEVIHLIVSGQTHGRNRYRSLTDKIRLFEKILSGLDAIIFIRDLIEDRTIWTNGNYLKILGYENEEVLQFRLGMSREDVHPNDREVMVEGDELIRTGKKDSYSGIYQALHKAGHWVWMYYNISVIESGEDGLPRYVLGWAVDFSSQIYSEKHLKELMAEHRRKVHEIQLRCLTTREKEIIEYLVNGHSCKEISNFFGITYYTALTHIRNLHHKLGISNLAELMHFAAESGLTA